MMLFEQRNEFYTLISKTVLFGLYCLVLTVECDQESRGNRFAFAVSISLTITAQMDFEQLEIGFDGVVE